MKISTKAIHCGEELGRAQGAVVTPIYQSATYMANGESNYHDIKYTRVNNTPNQLVLHEKLAALELAESALVTSSGMSAITTTLLSVLKKNGHIIYLSASPESIYENIKHRSHRPLLNVPDPQLKITEMLEERIPFYEKADVTVNADHRTINQIAEDVLKVIADE